MPEKNILIADDDQVILNILKEMIQHEGYKVFLASNGKEAVEAIQINPIDLAILDIKMPIMDGIEALEKIKKIDQSIEILIMTGYADLETLRQAISDHGAFDYILKPFKRNEILNGIQNALLKRDFNSQKKLREKELEERILQLEKEFHERTHQLRESQIKYRDIVENSNDVIVVVQDGRLKFTNSKAVELTGYRQEELMTMSFLEIVHPEDREMVAERYQREDFPSIFSFRALRKSGESLFVEINAVRTTWEKRQATLNIIRDITERKRAEEQLKRRITQLTILSQASASVASNLSLEDVFEAVVQGLSGTFDYRLIGIYLLEQGVLELKAHVGYSSPPDPSIAHVPLEKGVIGRTARTGEPQLVANVKEDADFFYGAPDITSEICLPVKRGDNILGVLNVESGRANKPLDASDFQLLTMLSNHISIAIENAKLYDASQQELAERKQAEENLTASIKEKELLLQEIHHRVKNNMQVISSLLKLQAETIQDETLRAPFRDSENRIRAMSLVHEKLYQSRDFTHILFKDYLTSLIRYLYRSYAPQAGRIELVTEIEELPLNITHAIPCGLIVNELLSNALKHAFPEARTGTITISLRSPEKDTIEISVSDNGIGIPEEIDLKTTKSLGLHLVTILVEDQLKGTIELERMGGTTFHIVFRVPE